MRYLPFVSAGKLTIYIAETCSDIGVQHMYSAVYDMPTHLSFKNKHLYRNCAEIFDAERR